MLDSKRKIKIIYPRCCKKHGKYPMQFRQNDENNKPKNGKMIKKFYEYYGKWGNIEKIVHKKLIIYVLDKKVWCSKNLTNIKTIK